MKKTLLSLMISFILIALVFFFKVYASTTPTPTTIPIPNPLPDYLKDLPSVIKWITGIIYPLSALGLLTMLVYAGTTRLTSAGDAEKEKKSMQILTATISGFVIIVLSGIIVNTVCALLGVQCF
jgi:hypothetical protein